MFLNAHHSTIQLKYSLMQVYILQSEEDFLYHFVFAEDATFIIVEQIENFIHSKQFQGATLGNLFALGNLFTFEKEGKVVQGRHNVVTQNIHAQTKASKCYKTIDWVNAETNNANENKG